MKLDKAEKLNQDDVIIKAVSPVGGNLSTEDSSGFFNHIWETEQDNDTMGELDKNKLYYLLAAYSIVFSSHEMAGSSDACHFVATDVFWSCLTSLSCGVCLPAVSLPGQASWSHLRTTRAPVDTRQTHE